MQIFLTVDEYRTRLINAIVKMAESLPKAENISNYKKSEAYQRYLQLAFHAVYGAYTARVGLYKLCDDVFTVDKNGNKITHETIKNITQEECDEFNQQEFYANKRTDSEKNKIDGVFAELKPYDKRQNPENYMAILLKTLTLPFRGQLELIAKEAYELGK